MEGSSVGGAKCPQCSADVTTGEKFCAACGAAVVEGVQRPMDMPPEVIGLGLERDARIGRARKWLLAMSIILTIGGLIMWAINKDTVEKDIRQIELQAMTHDAAALDALYIEEQGMTWAEVKADARGQVTLQLAVQLGLAVLFFALWIWAKRNALAATVTALLVFITFIGANAVVDPKTLMQGLIIKIFFIAALAKAISAAQEERRLQAHMPRATIA